MIDFATAFHRVTEPDGLRQILNRLHLAQNMLALFEGRYGTVRMAVGIIGDDNALAVTAVKLGLMLAVADAGDSCRIQFFRNALQLLAVRITDNCHLGFRMTKQPIHGKVYPACSPQNPNLTFFHAAPFEFVFAIGFSPSKSVLYLIVERSPMDKKIKKVDKTVKNSFGMPFLPDAERCGIRCSHSKEFRIDRACDPFGSVLILHFRSAALIRTEKGIERALPGDCMVHAPDFPQFHTAVPEATVGYVNDWIHATADSVLPFVQDTGLPLNHLIRTRNPDLLASEIASIRRECLLPDAHSPEFIRLELMLILRKLLRANDQELRLQTAFSASEKRYYPVFCRLRAFLFQHCSEDLSLAEISARVNLSKERFAALYRKFFASSPYSDLMDARIILAKSMLISDNASLKEIATCCGWRDEHYFSRCFRQRCGISPGAYRRAPSNEKP